MNRFISDRCRQKGGGNLMYRAMIIDDEEMVRWGIRDLIDWQKEGFALCEDGKDGRDGLRKLLSNSPDLALVDIKMPGLSGIELIRSAREAGFEGRFIILTGYSEFEFAKAAISLGVEEYLLKPVDEEELCHCVRKVRAQLDRQEEERIRRIAGEDAAKEELLRKILLERGSREELEAEMAEYGISFGEEILCVAILTDREENLQEGMGRAMEKMEDFLRDSSLYFWRAAMDGCYLLIGRGLDYRDWVDRLSERNKRIRAKYGEGLLLAVGNNVGAWYELCHSYEFAKYMLEQKFLLGQWDVLSIRAIEELQKKAENPPAEYFLMLAEVGDLEGIQEGVEKFGTYCIKNLMKETDVKIQVLYSLMTIQGSVEKKYGAWGGDIAEQMEALNRARKLEHVLELYAAILQEICMKIGREGSDTVIKRMYYYMEKNYGQEMKLESFARMFNYNANYLGKIFRKEMGDSFNNTLDSIRIANAKRLLEETDMKVYQISEQVGYKNIDYFYLKFKKYVGISPKEYKKEISGEKEEADWEGQGI